MHDSSTTGAEFSFGGKHYIALTHPALVSCDLHDRGGRWGTHQQYAARPFALKNRTKPATPPASAMSQPAAYGCKSNPHHIDRPLLPPKPPTAATPTAIRMKAHVQ